MTFSRDQHHIVYHYADGVADILGLSTAQQLAIRTAMHLALRELSSGYDATVADLTIEVNLLRFELEHALPGAAPVPAVAAPATIERNGTHPAPAHQVKALAAQLVSIDSQAAQESVTETQPDPTPPAGASESRPAKYKWATLDDVSLEIVTALERKRRQWQSVSPDDKRIIVLAMIGELGQDLPPGETLSIETLNRHKPRWMPTFASLSTALGMTWKQMLAAAPQL